MRQRRSSPPTMKKLSCAGTAACGCCRPSLRPAGKNQSAWRMTTQLHSSSHVAQRKRRVRQRQKCSYPRGTRRLTAMSAGLASGRKLASQEKPCLRPERFLYQSEAGCADQSGIIVEHNLDRYCFQQRLHAALVKEGFHERRFLHFCDDLSRDAGNEDAAGSHEFQSTVPSLRTEHAGENR